MRLGWIDRTRAGLGAPALRAILGSRALRRSLAASRSAPVDGHVLDEHLAAMLRLAVDGNLMGTHESSGTVQDGYSQLCRRAIFALRPARDDVVFARDDRGPIQLEILRADQAQILAATCSGEEFNGANQHLLGYSTAQQASAGETFFFDDGELGAELVRGFRRI
jgi:hypothetical protein